MNILYIHTHDTGRYIQPYGHSVPTPNLQKLAVEGTLFRQAYCAAPTCSPSRAGLLTGMAPHTAGMLGLAHRGFQLTEYDKHLVAQLNRSGYETILCGEQHEAPRTEMIGYQKILDMDNPKIGPKLRKASSSKQDASERDLENARKVGDYLRNRNDQRPFFLSYGIVNTHREFPQLDGTINPNYVQPPFPLADNPANREDMASYLLSARVMDDCVGIVLSALKESGLEENTLVLFTTDHGIAFPKMKCNLYDSGIGVSLILKYPGNKRQGEAIDALVSQLDIFPTLCDFLKLDKPEWLQGKSLLPLLTGKQDTVRDEIFAEVSWHAAFEPMRCIRTNRYKLIKFYDNHDGYVPANIDDSSSKQFLVDHGLLQQVRDKEMLFDLYHDPVERINLIDHPKYQEVREDLNTRLISWMQETDDPLIAGPLKRPQQAVVNRLSCLSPSEENFE